LEEDRRDVLEAGCDDFLAKPFKETDIFEIQHKQIGVQYVYEDGDQLISEDNFELSVESLSAIDKESLNALLNAILDGDTSLMREFIDEIGQQDKRVATALTQKVKGYQFQTISDLIMEVQV
jgi:hypothetical protein